MNILKFEILVLQIIFIQPIVSAIVVDKMNRSMLFFLALLVGMEIITYLQNFTCS